MFGRKRLRPCPHCLRNSPLLLRFLLIFQVLTQCPLLWEASSGHSCTHGLLGPLSSCETYFWNSHRAFPLWLLYVVSYCSDLKLLEAHNKPHTSLTLPLDPVLRLRETVWCRRKSKARETARLRFESRLLLLAGWPQTSHLKASVSSG